MPFCLFAQFNRVRRNGSRSSPVPVLLMNDHCLINNGFFSQIESAIMHTHSQHMLVAQSMPHAMFEGKACHVKAHRHVL